jgi:type IV pilus assembly protein PilA
MLTMTSRLTPTRKQDDGFTLIELMVVVMIIAVLMAIAIPTFLGSQNKAKDRSAQSSLRNALTAARTIYVDGSDYAKATTGLTGTLEASEPELNFVAAGTASAKPIDVSVSTPLVSPATISTTFYGAALSGSGTCFYIRDDVTVGATSTAGTQYMKGTSATNCTGTFAAGLTTYTATGWA